MDNTKLFSVSLLSSSGLNNKETLSKYTERILEFLNKNIPEHSEVSIGNIKNGTLIDFLKEKQIELNVRRQHPKSVGSSNKKNIKESDIILFLHYNHSNNIQGFIEYANNLEDKTCHILELIDN